MIGQRIAYFRKLRRFTQQQLASRTHVSVSLLSKVEAGLRPATPALVAALAPSLSVSVSELNGQPYFRNAPGAEQIHTRIPALHGALARYDLPREESRPPRTASELREDVGRVNGLRQSGSYSRLAAILPDIIDEACRAAHVAHGSPRKEIFRSLAAIYFAAHSVAYKLGYDQLATICEDRIVWAANESQDSLWIAVANWTRCTSFLATGGPGYRAGLQLLSATRRTLEDDLPCEDPALLSVYGALHLREAILAARAADPSPCQVLTAALRGGLLLETELAPAGSRCRLSSE